MKIDRLETHDRLLEFKKQSDYISQGCAECIRTRPKEFGDHPFYIFAHCRTHDNGWTKRLIWQARLRKPKAQTNSMLFKSYPPGDTIKIIWMIPVREQWPEYDPKNMLASDIVIDSVHKFRDKERREAMEEKESDDLSEEAIDAIYREISINANKRLQIQKMYEEALKPMPLVDSLVSLDEP